MRDEGSAGRGTRHDEFRMFRRLHVWRPEENGIETASDLIEPLKRGIAAMKADQERFEALNPPNGWGSYDRFLGWLERLIEECNEHPDAKIRAYR